MGVENTEGKGENGGYSIFSFSHHVFKSLLFQSLLKSRLFGKGLMKSSLLEIKLFIQLDVLTLPLISTLCFFMIDVNLVILVWMEKIRMVVSRVSVMDIPRSVQIQQATFPAPLAQTLKQVCNYLFCD